MKLTQSKFSLLRNKECFEILDGDAKFGPLTIEGKSTDIEISMPYLSGSSLCKISKKFGLSAIYNKQEKGKETKSRWEYLEDLLDHCIKENLESDLLVFLFSKEQFNQKLQELSSEEVDFAYNKITTVIIEKINQFLNNGKNELVKIGNRFVIQPIGTLVEIETPLIKTINNDYIKTLSSRAMKDISNGDFDSAITKSRTLLEEVFCYIIEKKGEKPENKGDIGKLYNHVKKLNNMHENPTLNKQINELLSGLNKIVSAIAVMRNKESDSHGVGSERVGLTDYQARLFVNAASTMAEFLLAVSKNGLY